MFLLGASVARKRSRQAARITAVGVRDSVKSFLRQASAGPVLNRLFPAMLPHPRLKISSASPFATDNKTSNKTSPIQTSGNQALSSCKLGFALPLHSFL